MNPPGLTPKQHDSIAKSTGLVSIWEGAVSSGKTVASIVRWLIFISQTLDLPGEIVLTGRTRDSAWRNVILPMMQLFPGSVEGNMGSPFCYIWGRRVHVIGASDSQAESVIRGMTCLSIYMDEITVLPESYFKMALSRLRVVGRDGGTASKLFGSTNPDNPRHWLKKDYLDNLPPDWRSFHFELTDNPYLPKGYVKAMQSQFSGVFHDRFIRGLWRQGHGLVWDSWDESKLVVAVEDIPQIERTLTLGIDFGTTHPTVGVLLGLSGPRLYVLDEWCPQAGDSGVMSPSRQSVHLREWLQRKPPRWQPEHVAVDPAAKHFRDQLLVDGMATIPAWNNVLAGIQTVHSLFSLGLLSVSDTCTGLIDQIPGYVWDEKASERGLDQPVKQDDDYCDALRYAVYTATPQWRGIVPVTIPTPLDQEERIENDQYRLSRRRRDRDR